MFSTGLVDTLRTAVVSTQVCSRGNWAVCRGKFRAAPEVIRTRSPTVVMAWTWCVGVGLGDGGVVWGDPQVLGVR